MTNNENKDFTRTTFSNFNLRPKAPTEDSWYFSTYTNDYKLQDSKPKKLADVGSTPPEFVLRQFESNTKTSLASYAGKVVVLEFWIVHCGHCIDAVPRLNQLAKAFKDSGVEIVSINTYDPDPTIAGFKGRHKPDYPILTEGEATSDAYGVSGFPAIFVIGKDGKIAYASAGLFEKEVETAIKTSLEK